MRTRHERWAWWSEDYVDDDGFALCAILKPASVTKRDTDEMSEVELEGAFLDAGWPFEPADSWAEDDEDT